MEKDTVLLDIEKYNDLRDFQNKVSEGYIEVYSNSERTYFTTKDKAIEKIAKINAELISKLKKLKYPESEKKTLKDVKEMSVREFKKWRKDG